MFSATVLISSSYRLFFLCIAVHGGELGVNRTGSADTNKKLFEQKHDRQRQGPPANATTSANATSASAKFASIKAAANTTSTRDNAGQKVLLKTGQAAQTAPADECLLKASVVEPLLIFTVPVPTLEKLWFRSRFRLLTSSGSVSS